MSKKPKNMQTMDGNTAASYVSYAFSEVAGIYPITPSSNMAEVADQWSARGKTNMFGQPVKVVEMQSEGGAAGVMHGSLQAGALTTTYTASQGLLLMIPNMYKMAGQLLPAVIHVSARALAGHALSIFGDHSDVMSVRQTGFALLASSNVQEAMDLAAVAHLSTLKARVPFVHFFDGFRTSHEIQKIEVLDYDDLYKITDHDAIKEFRARALNPEHPVTRGTAQNPDIFFQGKEAANAFYNNVPNIVEQYMGEINKLTGKDYGLFNYYGAADADRIIIAMGSATDTIKETVDYMNAKGEKIGLVIVHLFRPFSMEHLMKVIPESVTKIAVLDRCKEPGALGEPLYLDICTAVQQAGKSDKYSIIAGRYGLGSKDVTPAQILAVYENLGGAAKTPFTVGINDDVTHLSLTVGAEIDVTPKGTTSCKFWGIGGDGTVGAAENSIKIIGNHTDMYAQSYSTFDSKKTSGLTASHLRFGEQPIRSPYLVKTADFVGCHVEAYVRTFDMTSDLKQGGTFLLNCHWSADDAANHLPNSFKRALAEKEINFYIIDAGKIAREIGLGHRINTVLQAAFFKLANIIPIDDAVAYIKQANADTYKKRGQKVVDMNNAAVDAGLTSFVKVDVQADWKNLENEPESTPDVIKFNDKVCKDFIGNVMMPIIADKGHVLPVSAFQGREDGTFPQGTAAYEKRGIASLVPKWLPENCIACNFCSYVCPHAVIRPFLLTDEEKAKMPAGFQTLPGTSGTNGMELHIGISTLDCTGCTSCAKVCPGKGGKKALEMVSAEGCEKDMPLWYAAMGLSAKELPFDKATIRGSQYATPLLEFSGACAGCGETPYAKLATQLFGDRMYIANATGCSSIWGASAPSTPYTTNHKGHGPAWANSLFEDNAEFGFGMHWAVTVRRDKMADVLTEVAGHTDASAELKDAARAWLVGKEDGEKSKAASEALRKAISGMGAVNADFDALIKHICDNDDILVKKSMWIFGGDGWAYDIGYGGLDHVLASGENINVLVFDTEVYSNTGGQASKSTPTAAIAKFAAAGKRIRKKDLGMMAMNYGYVYVAQVAMGANMNQLIKAMTEAEAHDGPSLIIAYSPCIAQGIDMSNTQDQMKRAVEAGYWHLYRYNPALEDEGKNPFQLDSKPPTADFAEYINSEGRYTSLKIAFPEEAEALFQQAAKDAARRFASYKRLAEQ
ncbi:MAG: pyruvate:ferredoxin (flavodoxin) oxidoreductase [Defluviitaleaceae bacterium]|nr:pyruvate:ferredoxin (flavodoxin) oxidoreductase [Defluviitaleaceae bacterium]